MKGLLVDSNKNLTGMGNLTSTGTVSASTLTGTLSILTIILTL